MQAKKSDTRLQTVKRIITLRGLNDIMFDRYPGENSTKLSWEQKIYQPPGTSKVCMPATNISSLLTAHNTNSAPKRLRPSKEYKKVANACLSFTSIRGLGTDPRMIEFTREGEVIETGMFGLERDEKSGIYLHRAVARLEKGIPNPKERPVLPTPWELSFELTIFQNKEIKEQEIKNLIEEAGIAIGLGTFRGVFGKYVVERWEEVS